jgi:iron complex outermembrane recepter protein
MSFSLRHVLLSGASALIMAGAGAAQAQTTPPPPPVDTQTPTVTLKPVVITARHRAERAQSVPVSLTTVSASQIRIVGSANISRLQQLVPSLSVQAFNPRNTSLNIRGLGAVPNLANDGLEGGVGVYLDGVLLARPAQVVFDLPDLEDIEVLRGPQGTLFGKNTVSGAINITTRLPSFTPEADASVSFGTQNYAQLKASVSSALFGSDKVAVRLTVQGTQHNGYISNTTNSLRYGNQDDKAVRLQILANVNPNLTLRAIFDYSSQKENCCVNLPIGVVTNYAPNFDGGAAIVPSVLARYAALGYKLPPISPFSRNTDVDSPLFYHMETGGASLQADYNLSGYTITSISAVRYWNWYPHNDIDDTALPIYTAANTTDYQRQVSQELRLTSPLGNLVDYTAGLYYFYQSINDQSLLSYGSAAGDFLAGSTTGALASIYNAALNGFSAANNGVYDTQSIAAYGQATWHVTPQFDITTGLRYTYEYKTGYFNEVQQLSAGAIPYSSLSAASQTVRNSFSPVTSYSVSTSNSLPSGLITFSYKLQPNILAYATYSHGAKSAGINLVSNSAVPKTVAPETVDNYELGVKSTLLDGRLLLNGDLFWNEDKNYQGTLIGTTGGGSVFTYIASIPRVRSRGFEIDSQAQVTQNLFVFFSGVYDNAYYASNPNAPCPIEEGGPTHSCNLSGRPLVGVSAWTGSFGGEYDQPLPPIGRFQNVVAYVSGNYLLKSGFYSGADDSAYSYIPGYGVGNLAFGVKQANEAWDLSGWIHNFTDARYYLTRGASDQFPTYNLIVGQVGDPISGGVTLAAKF